MIPSRFAPSRFARTGLLALLVGSGAQAANTVTITDAWVRLPAVTGRPAAAYLTITGGAVADRMVEASSPLAGRTELHSMTMTGNVMKMAPLAGLDVPAHGQVSFAPNGSHIMLFGLDPAVKPGATMPLALRFEKAGTVMIDARTIAAGETAPAKPAPVPMDHSAH